MGSACTGTTTLNTGTNSYSWNGQGNNGVTWPAGSYTIAVTASGKAITVTSQVSGTISGADISANPPTLTVHGQSHPISSIQSLGSSGIGTPTSSLSSFNSWISNLTNLISSLVQKTWGITDDREDGLIYVNAKRLTLRTNSLPSTMSKDVVESRAAWLPNGGATSP